MNAALRTDVAILGMGPAGTAAGLFLAKAGIPSVLVDKATFPRDKICGDALSGKVVEVLRKLDPALVDEIAGEAAFLGSWGVTFVAPNLKSLRVPFKKQIDKTAQAPGFIVKRLDFDDWLVRKCRAQAGLSLMEGVEIKSFRKEGDRWLLLDAAGEVRVNARLIIAADGAQSRFVRQVAGYELEPLHHCAGIRQYYRGVTGMDGDNFIELHFLKDFLPGYFWIFPLPGGWANVGVGMRSDKLAKKKVNLKQRMFEIIEAYPQLKERFAGAERVGEARGFGLPLGSRQRKLSGDGWMLTGDAGWLIDPFTGEGIGNALYSGMFAAETAAEALARNDFSAATLSAYDTRVWARLWEELKLSRRMQGLVNYPWLFNLVVNKANRNKLLAETISCMFEDLDMRDRLRSPSFYLKLLFSNGH